MKKTPTPASRKFPARVHPALWLLMIMFSASLMAQDEPDQAPEAQAVAAERPLFSTGMDPETIANNQSDAAVWLIDEDQNRVLSLFRHENEVPARGALLILSDEGVSAASGMANALREPLTEMGWAVMTLGLPAPPFAVQHWLRRQNSGPQAPSDRADEPEESEEPEEPEESNDQSSAMINVMEEESPDDVLGQYRDRIISALTAGVDELGEREYQRIVLVGIGRAAGHVTRQVREDGRAAHLIWIAPQFYTDESSGLTELLASASAPSILELYSTLPGDRTADRSASERASALKRAGISGYRRQPVAMSRQPQPREAAMLANRISAWLRSQSEAR